MAAIQNQGFRVDLNLKENENDTQTLNNLGGAGIANDLRIIQNNLRNTDVLGFAFVNTNNGIPALTQHFLNLSTSHGYYDDADGFFHFPRLDFVFTNGDRIKFDTIVGSNVFTPTEKYEVINSNGVNKFQLALQGDSLPVTVPAGLTFTDINLIRDNSVSIENTRNFIRPDNISGYSFVDSINGSFDSIITRTDVAKFDISRKYKGTEDTITTDEIKFEGEVKVSDPGQYNDSTAKVNGGFSTKSPGVYIGSTRAFSSDNNPWTKTFPGLLATGSTNTESTQVSIGELFIDADLNNNPNSVFGVISIQNADIETFSTPILVSSYTHKLPIVINGETYFMLMTQT